MNQEMIETACPSCAKPLLAPPRMAGRLVKCPKCGGHLQIPVPLAATVATDDKGADPALSAGGAGNDPAAAAPPWPADGAADGTQAYAPPPAYPTSYGMPPYGAGGYPVRP